MEAINILENFAHDLTLFSPQRIEEPIKISLPYELYKQFVERIDSYMSMYLRGVVKGPVKINTSPDISFIITCKEIDIDNINKYITTYFNDIH